MGEKTNGELFREYMQRHPHVGQAANKSLIDDFKRDNPGVKVADGYSRQIIAQVRKAMNSKAVAVKPEPVAAGVPDYKSFFDMLRDVRELAKRCGGYDNLIAVATRLRDEGM